MLDLKSYRNRANFSYEIFLRFISTIKYVSVMINIFRIMYVMLKTDEFTYYYCYYDALYIVEKE